MVVFVLVILVVKELVVVNVDNVAVLVVVADVVSVSVNVERVAVPRKLKKNKKRVNFLVCKCFARN